MADYLFDEILGIPVTIEEYRAAKDALIPLRNHPGRLGWAVCIFLEGGETVDDYTLAGNAIFHVARLGEPGVTSLQAAEQEATSAEIISLLPRLGPAGGQTSADGQLSFPGIED